VSGGRYGTMHWGRKEGVDGMREPRIRGIKRGSRVGGRRVRR